MHVIQESEWGQVTVHNWSDLTPHQWECFRLALMEARSEQEVQGVILEYSRTSNEMVAELIGRGVKIVQSPTIIQTKSEMITSIVVSERDYKSEMIKYLPLYERKSSIFNEILDAADREFRNTEQQSEVVERNIFLDTAIESLSIFERDLGIKTVTSLRYDQRREQITSRNRASFDQTTEETIKSVASAYGNGEVDVSTTSTPGLYSVTFIGKGIPNNIDGLKEALDIIIPAHLGIKYLFTFSPWQDVNKLIWGEVSAKTWDELRIWDEVN